MIKENLPCKTANSQILALGLAPPTRGASAQRQRDLRLARNQERWGPPRLKAPLTPPLLNRPHRKTRQGVPVLRQLFFFNYLAIFFRFACLYTLACRVVSVAGAIVSGFGLPR